ncbi:NmrA family NAD(P)-binding protein [Azospirillum rugosum]|uniref:Uncharacterized protein YbjT (DUF2867 family) n=1 Tax=Azospirillum rugosum TaxID=416170 RepID=A0ABS4SPN2_9PROT|nr:NmrA family NAD(P)-binding protein [Azospirillum rugosum]MBP2294525.1 uncharacterized protein YbjT (DUF2867 family) [Azospirillum rugosum]MDQ0529030.1 uncharacterized protein YbjT (DUF2867 family) [Azospirillum rugosum]
MFAVMGVTGHTGAAVAETLLARGAEVRVVVRDAGKAAPWVAKGAEVAAADARDADALTAAFQGVEGVYALNPPGYGSDDPLAEARAVGAALADAVAHTHVPHVVALSSIGGHRPDGTGIIVTTHLLENALRAAGRPLTIVRAGFFMENWANVLAPALGQGVLPCFTLPLDKPFPTVDVADIGRTAAEALLGGPRGLRVVELNGPADRTPQDAAAALSAAAGRPVQAVAVPREAWVPTLLAAGLAQRPAELLAEMYDGLNEGRVVQEDGTERANGTVTLEQAMARLVQGARAAA